MNDFEEFCNAWKTEFPGEDLPTVWDEDIGTNLHRHKKNLEYLQSEIRKEEFYVTFLEKLVLRLHEKSHNIDSVREASTELKEHLNSEQPLSYLNSPRKLGKSDFVTVISISNKNLSTDDVSVNSKPSAPPKPPKQYLRSASSDSPPGIKPSKPEDIIAWTKQQIQQLQSKQGFRIEEAAGEIPSSSYENVVGGNPKNRSGYENVAKTRSSYENVFTGPTVREQHSDESDGSQAKFPTTDIDFEQGRVARTSALFQQHLLPKLPISSGRLPSSPHPKPTKTPQTASVSTSLSEAFYDTVPHEENISYIDAEDYIYLLDKPVEQNKTKEKERNSETVKSFCSYTSDDSNGTGSLRRRLYANITSLDGVETTRTLSSKQQLILQNFFDGEESYVAALSLVLDYKKALTLALNSSQPVLSREEISNIFFHIPQLHAHHTDLLQQIKSIKVIDWNLIQVAQLLKIFSENALPDYAIFLSNVKEALETTRKACHNSPQFGDLARRIKFRVNNQPQGVVSLEDLLHRPVARIQRHVAVIQDLLDVSSQDEPAYLMLQEAQQVTKAFLSEFSTNQLQSLFPVHTSKSSAPLQPNRHLVKNGFLVELQADGKRKQRHVFLFTDILVCTKYKGVGVQLEIKWYLPLAQVFVTVDESAAKISMSAITNVISLRSQAAAVRTQMERCTAGSERQRKKLASLEAKLLLDSPNLPLRFSYKSRGTSKVTQSYAFLFSSEYERTLWVEAFETLKRNLERLPPINLHIEEVESQIKACRTAVEPPSGSVKKSSNPAMSGEIQLVIHSLKGLQKAADAYIVIELDSYGHFFHKARTKMAVKTAEPRWEEDFNLELEGTRGLRILLYEEDSKQVAVLRGKAELDLSLAWLNSLKGPQQVPLSHQLSKASVNSVGSDELILCLTLRYLSHNVTLRRPALRPTSCTIFGVPIDEVCLREKRPIPFIIFCCTREVERRGLEELGIYRVSGLATDIARLRKAFDTRGAETDAQLRDADVNSVSGLLKLYLRQLPEALFTDRLYPRFLQAFSTLNAAASLNGGEDMEEDGGVRALTQLFSSLPQLNQDVILYLLDHLVRVNAKEIKNKMSLHNLATIFGPTLLRPAPSTNVNDNIDQLSIGTIDVMAQAGILHFFLLRRSRRIPIHGPPVAP